MKCKRIITAISQNKRQFFFGKEIKDNSLQSVRVF